MTMRRTINNLLTSTLLVLAASPVYAGGLYMNLQDQVAKDNQANSARDEQVLFGAKDAGSNALITQSGVPSNLPPVSGFADNVELKTALRQIVPNGWVVKKRGSVAVSTPVSWKGNRNWLEILNDLAAQGNFSAEVNWNKQELLIIGTMSAPVSVSGPVLVPSEITSWELNPNLSLKENVEAWAKIAGWTVSWDGVDYPVTARTVLNGKFDDADGPLKQLAAAYLNAEQPLAIHLKEGNKVVRVENLHYATPTQNEVNLPEKFKLDEPVKSGATAEDKSLKGGQ